MLIKSDTEYNLAQERLQGLRSQAQAIRAELIQRNFGEEGMSLATAAQNTLAEEIAWDIGLYERLKAGEIEATPEFAVEDRGKALICLRLVKGWTQRQLADALGIAESVVARDEYNEYCGISLDKYGKVLRVLGFEDHPRFVGANRAQVISLSKRIVACPPIYRMAASFIPKEQIAIHAEVANHA